MPIIEAIEAVQSNKPSNDEALNDAIAASAIDIHKAMEIAQKHGYSGDAQALRNWSKRSFTAKTVESQNESKAKLNKLGLEPHFDGQNYKWLAL